MSENTKIEWADHTFNPWEGCQKVSPGCDHCYAEARNVRFGGGTATNWGPGAPRRRTSVANWRKPIKWNADAATFAAANDGRRQRVFCASLADVFDNAVDVAWLVDLLELMRITRDVDWLVLTKRIGNVRSRLGEAIRYLAGQPDCNSALGGWLYAWQVDCIAPKNIWIGATIVNQEEADRDIPKLLSVPAAKRFLSMEPLLGAADISGYMWPVHGWWKGPQKSYREAKAAGAECGLKRQALVSAHARFVDWVIVGGESGLGARPMNPIWVRSLRDQCIPAGVPFLFKQWGEYCGDSAFRASARRWTMMDRNGVTLQQAGSTGRMGSITHVAKVGKKAAGRLLDGREWNEVPA